MSKHVVFGLKHFNTESHTLLTGEITNEVGSKADVLAVMRSIAPAVVSEEAEELLMAA